MTSLEKKCFPIQGFSDEDNFRSYEPMINPIRIVLQTNKLVLYISLRSLNKP